MITFFHTADLHFGVENYGKIDPKTGIHTRLLDFKSTFEECIQKAINDNTDFFLIVGDVYKTATPTPTQQKIFAQLLFRLYNAKIPVIIIVGNHDHSISFGKANAVDLFDYLPLEGFKVISKPESFLLTTKNGPVQIVGIPWPTRNNIVTKDAYRFKTTEEINKIISEQISNILISFAYQLDPKIPSILAAHLTVSSGVFSGSEKCSIIGSDPIFLPSQLLLEPFDYIALGHLHRHQNLNPNGKIPLVYSGSLERIDFGERNDQKGFCKVSIDIHGKQKNSFYEFIKTKTRKMIQLDIVLEKKIGQTNQIIEEIKKTDIHDSILKIKYSLINGVQDNIDLFDLQMECSKAFYLVGIVPVYQNQTREVRSIIKQTMDMRSLLESYFITKKHDASFIKLLLGRIDELTSSLEKE